MTERLAPPDPHPGLVDRIAAWLFPGLYPSAIEGGITESEFARRQAAAAAAAEGNIVLICTRIIPDPEPEAGQ
jgi:hypothetical protein